MLLQVLTSRAVGLNGARGGNVVGGHRVAQQRQHARTVHGHRLIEVFTDGKERRLLDVGGVFPAVGTGAGHRWPPGFGPGENVRVLPLEHVFGHLSDRCPTSALLGQMSFRNTSLPSRPDQSDRLPDRCAWCRRSRRQPPAAVTPASWCALPDAPGLRSSGCRTAPTHHQITVVMALEICFRQRPGVTDAGGAAVADQIEAHSSPGHPADRSFSRYSVTTLDPGASDVFTQGLT